MNGVVNFRLVITTAHGAAPLMSLPLPAWHALRAVAVIHRGPYRRYAASSLIVDTASLRRHCAAHLPAQCLPIAAPLTNGTIGVGKIPMWTMPAPPPPAEPRPPSLRRFVEVSRKSDAANLHHYGHKPG